MGKIKRKIFKKVTSNLLANQLEYIFSDIYPDAVKIGMVWCISTKTYE